eukprot:scaffold82319_cov24-Prasinocladus_malaysianus.AAC.1
MPFIVRINPNGKPSASAIAGWKFQLSAEYTPANSNWNNIHICSSTSSSSRLCGTTSAGQMTDTTDWWFSRQLSRIDNFGGQQPCDNATCAMALICWSTKPRTKCMPK